MNKVVNSVLAATVLLASFSFYQTASAAIPFFSKNEVPSLAPMLEKTTPAIVSIAVEGKQVSQQRIPEVFRHFFGAPNQQQQERPFKGLGSGVIIDAKNGYVVTNNHVVDNADKIVVKLTDGREISAKKLGADERSDIALLKIDAKNLTSVKLANSDKLRVGDFVIAIGNPFGLSQTVTSGIVSALGRSGLNIGGLEDFIQTDAAINRGNSGGALVNLHGELVGINTAIFGPGGGNVGIGFAIPANMMKSLVDQILEYGEVRRGRLGISGQDVGAGLAEAMDLSVNKGAFVSGVEADTAAAKGGIQAGDIIVAVNGNDIQSFHELRAKIGTLGADAKVKLTLVRKGKEMDIDVVLGHANQNEIAAQDVHPALQGAILTNGNTQSGTSGVVISEMEERSPAARTGLQKGDVIVGANRNRVKSLAELRRVLEKTDGVVALNIKRGRNSMYLVIR